MNLRTKPPPICYDHTFIPIEAYTIEHATLAANASSSAASCCRAALPSMSVGALSRPSVDETSSTFSSASVIRMLSTPDADGDFGSGAATVQPASQPPPLALPPPLPPPPASSVWHHIPPPLPLPPLLLVLFVLGLGVAVRVLRHRYLASPSGSSGGSGGRNLAEHPVRKTVAGEKLWRKLSCKRDKGEERSRLMDNDRWLGGDGCSRIDISAPQWSLQGE